MIGRCVGGHWPPLRLGNVQMVDKRCAEVGAPYGTTSAIRSCRAEYPSQRVARHGYPPGDPLLPFGQFTLCRACGE